MALPQYPIILKSKAFISDRTLQLNFELPPQARSAFTFIAGQFVQLQLPTQEGIKKRSYSIANAPTAFETTGQLEIAISLVEGGVASELFSQAEAGFALEMSGPFGALTLPDSIPGQLVLVSTGTGIAPYRSMLPLLEKQASQGTRVTLISGARHRAEQLYLDDFHQAKQIHVISCLSREPELTSDEQAGYVQKQFASLQLDLSTDLVYLCGNPFMVDDSITTLKEIGLPSRQIKREKYVYSGH